MKNSDLFFPIGFIPNEKGKKVFDDKNKKFESIEELLNDNELIRAMAFVNIIRKDRYMIDVVAGIVNKLVNKPKFNVYVNDFANKFKVDMEVARLRKNYLLRQKKLFERNRVR